MLLRLLAIAFLFISLIAVRFNCLAQELPFIYFSPKDGLVSNQLKNINQDSKGRLFFSTFNGLSIYDGSQFTNYTAKNGLDNDIVNCIIEMGEDSVWIITNTSEINCLVKGKLKKVQMKDSIPVINSVLKDEKGEIYLAAEQGLFVLKKDHISKIPLSDIKGNGINSYLVQLVSDRDYLLIKRDNALIRDRANNIYLYDKRAKKITSEIANITSLAKSPDGRIWASTPQKIMSVDLSKLSKGEIILNDLPEKFKKLRNLGYYFVLFDNQNNCWLGNQNNILIKVSKDGNIKSFTKESGLDFLYISHIFTDKEGISWIATNNAGVYKLVKDNFLFLRDVFGITFLSDIFSNVEKNQMLFFSSLSKKLIVTENGRLIKEFAIRSGEQIEKVFQTSHGMYGAGQNKIFRLIPAGNSLFPKIIFSDTTGQEFTGSLTDKYGNLFICGKNKVIGILKKKTPLSNSDDFIYVKTINTFADHLASDSKGNIWAATRSNELYQYELNPDNPSNYLQQKIHISPLFSNISPRSICIDKSDRILIGTRRDGIYQFSITDNNKAKPLFHITSEEWLSDNFITQLVCDSENNVWAASPSGLDKISFREESPIIENITRQYNVYQRVFKVILDNNHQAWGLLSNGIIKVSEEHKVETGYSPTLLLTLIKAGKDTIDNSDHVTLSSGQNNLTFHFAATSYLDEKQIRYSYQLSEGTNDQWSEPSNNASVTFFDLPPGKYLLKTKVQFPVGNYPEQIGQYHFTILPHWWQNWWFKFPAILFISLLLTGIIWFYYRKKLEVKSVVLEGQQAIEHERARIATDMHDDLGAGLSRIKFLSQSLSNRHSDKATIKTGLKKITDYSDEMTERIGEIIWALNQKNDTLADLVAYIRSYALEYLSNHDVACNMNSPLNLPETFIAGEMRRNIFLAVKECLHNIIKHAYATSVYFSIRLNELIEIIIHDNGRGIDWNNQRAAGMGLQNINKRMKEVNGKADFLYENGTKVILRIPLNL